MHTSSYQEMTRNRDRYLKSEHITVYDFGAMDVNGSYRPLFTAPRFRYVGIDLTAGAGVDQVMVSEFNCGLPDASADLIISGQCLEHCRQPFRLSQEMNRVCRRGGIVMIVAPFIWELHRYPVDCFRYLPDGMDSILKEAGFTVVKTYLNGKDCWGIGTK